MPKRDQFGEAIAPDFLGTEPEDLEAYRDLETVCLEHGFAAYERDPETGEILKDTRGCNLWRLTLPTPEAPPPPHTRTLSDVMPLNMDDNFDAAMATLPIYASLADKAKAALRANVPGVVVQARLRCSAATVCTARRELRAQLPEEEWPESLSNSKGQARRVNAERPNMRLGSGAHPMERRAAALGVSVSEASMLAADKARVTKYGERAKDLEAAARAREYRVRKKIERNNGEAEGGEE